MALLDDGAENRVYTLTGSEAVSYADIAEALSELTGKDVTYTPIETEAFLATLKARGLPDVVAKRVLGFALDIKKRTGEPRQPRPRGAARSDACVARSRTQRAVRPVGRAYPIVASAPSPPMAEHPNRSLSRRRFVGEATAGLAATAIAAPPGAWAAASALIEPEPLGLRDPSSIPMKTIGLEEHAVTPDVIRAWQALDPQWQPVAQGASEAGETGRRLAEIGPDRFAAMDAVGVDVQVLSLTAPGLHNLAPADAAALQVATNDVLAAAVRAHPDRLQAFATLATPSPAEAARELERAVTTLGMNGGMVFGRVRERNLDHPDFWPLFEAAEALRAPLYLHPQAPLPAVRAAYYNGFDAAVESAFATFGIGWYYETGVQLLRLVLSGVFDRFPGLQVIVGHWGEVVLFYLEETSYLARAAKLERSLPDYVRDHVFVTPSGSWNERYLRWTIETMGVDRVMFSTDYPFLYPQQGSGRRFLETADLSDADRQAIASGNWERLVAGIRR